MERCKLCLTSLWWYYNLNHVNALARGRRENNFQCVISKHNATDWVGEHFLWNRSQVNATSGTPLIDEKSTLVHVMAWCRQRTNHDLNQCRPRYTAPYVVTSSELIQVSRKVTTCNYDNEMILWNDDCFSHTNAQLLPIIAYRIMCSFMSYVKLAWCHPNDYSFCRYIFCMPITNIAKYTCCCFTLNHES